MYAPCNNDTHIFWYHRIMQEIGIESSLLSEILAGHKTIELRLGKPKFIKMRVGDMLRLREDVMQDGQLLESIPDQATVVITQLLYFEHLDEALSFIDFQAAIPSAKSKAEALAVYRKFYSPEDEEEYGVVAITFALS